MPHMHEDADSYSCECESRGRKDRCTRVPGLSIASSIAANNDDRLGWVDATTVRGTSRLRPVIQDDWRGKITWPPLGFAGGGDAFRG